MRRAASFSIEGRQNLIYSGGCRISVASRWSARPGTACQGCVPGIFSKVICSEEAAGRILLAEWLQEGGLTAEWLQKTCISWLTVAQLQMGKGIAGPAASSASARR